MVTRPASPEESIAKYIFLTTYLEYMQFVPTSLRVSFFWIAVTKLHHKIIRQCVCKGCSGHAHVLDTESSRLTNNKLHVALPVTVN